MLFRLYVFGTSENGPEFLYQQVVAVRIYVSVDDSCGSAADFPADPDVAGGALPAVSAEVRGAVPAVSALCRAAECFDHGCGRIGFHPLDLGVAFQ